VKYNSGKQRSPRHLLCEDSNHFYPVETGMPPTSDAADLDENLKDMEYYMTAKHDVDKPVLIEEEKKKEPDEDYKADLKKLILLEVKICQPSWKNSGVHRNLRMGNFSYRPDIKKKIGTEGQADEDMEVEFVNLTGKETFKGTLSYVVNYLIQHKTGCTLGNGDLQNDYAYINDENTCYDIVDAAITSFNEKLIKGGWKNGIKEVGMMARRQKTVARKEKANKGRSEVCQALRKCVSPQECSL